MKILGEFFSKYFFKVLVSIRKFEKKYVNSLLPHRIMSTSEKLRIFRRNFMLDDSFKTALHR